VNNNARRPVGIFDSGVGGLTVASAIHYNLPNERFIYFGDTAHLPYGEKSHDAIRYYSLRICRFLLENDCKAIVVACNSASTAAYEVLLEFFKDKAVYLNVMDQGNCGSCWAFATTAAFWSNAALNSLKANPDVKKYDAAGNLEIDLANAPVPPPLMSAKGSLLKYPARKSKMSCTVMPPAWL